MTNSYLRFLNLLNSGISISFIIFLNSSNTNYTHYNAGYSNLDIYCLDNTSNATSGTNKFGLKELVFLIAVLRSSSVKYSKGSI